MGPATTDGAWPSGKDDVCQGLDGPARRPRPSIPLMICRDLVTRVLGSPRSTEPRSLARARFEFTQCFEGPMSGLDTRRAWLMVASVLLDAGRVDCLASMCRTVQNEDSSCRCLCIAFAHLTQANASPDFSHSDMSPARLDRYGHSHCHRSRRTAHREVHALMMVEKLDEVIS